MPGLTEQILHTHTFPPPLLRALKEKLFHFLFLFQKVIIWVNLSFGPKKCLQPLCV